MFLNPTFTTESSQKKKKKSRKTTNTKIMPDWGRLRDGNFLEDGRILGGQFCVFSKWYFSAILSIPPKQSCLGTAEDVLCGHLFSYNTD